MKVPAGWKIKSVELLFEVQLGKMLNQAAKNGGRQYPYLTNTNVQWGRFRLDGLNTMAFTEKEKTQFTLRNGDLVVCEGGEVGRCAIWSGELSPCYYQKALHRLRPIHKDEILPHFMLAYMQSIAGTKRLGDLTSQSSIAHLTREKLLELEVLVPPVGEQQQMALILGTCDQGVTAQEKLLAAKLERKRGLMQQLLTGKTRFEDFVRSDKKVKTRYGDFPEDWLQVHIGDIADEAGKKNGDGKELPVLSCTKYRGLVNSLEYFGKRIFSEDTRTYRIVERGDFAYATNHIEEGSIGYQNLHDAALISPMYTVFRTRAGVDHEFFFKLIKTELYRHIFKVNTSGTIDRRGALRWDEFALIKVFLPGVPEQKRIALVLSACDREIELLQKHLDALKDQKRGLMQKLLTGEVRVKVKTPRPGPLPRAEREKT